MKNNHLRSKHQLKKIVLLGLFSQVFVISSAWSEQIKPEVEMLDEMVITGSYIMKPVDEGTTPVVTLDREYIDRSGATTINELFRKSVYNSAGIIDEQFTQGFAPGSAGINLRGLGVSRTLVLLDGRRMPIFPFAQSRLDRNDQSSFVDVNLIPLSAVERIEILKDGASALYGADAVAGVVNIITHKDYDGAKLSGQYGATLKVDGEEGRAEIVAGKTWEKTNLTLAFDYLNRSEVKAKDRHYSASALGIIDNRSNAGNPGSFINFSGESGRPQPDPRCSAENIRGPFCSFDFASFSTLIPEVERTGFMSSLEHEFNENISFFARGMYSHTETERSLAPAPINDLLIVEPDNPNNPFPGDTLGVIYRFNELGSRVDTFNTDSFNFVGGFKGKIVEWNWELGAGMGLVETQNKGINGYATQTSLQQAVTDGDLNLFGASSTFDPASVKVIPTRKGESKVYYVDFKTNGTLLELPYGTLKMAVGTEYRREKFSDSFDDITASGDIVSIGGTGGRGGREIEAAYFEFYATVFDQLEMQFAGRMDHYSDFGTTFNPKFSLRWQPIKSLSFRGNVGTGFKAPALHELYSGDINAFEAVFDPVTQQATEVDLVSSGNPDLDAEESFNHGLGISWDATDWWQLSLDYWNIRNNDAVVSSPQFYVNNEARFPGNVIRDDSGELIAVLSPFSNVAAQKIWGLDMNTSVDWEWETAGYFRLEVGGTYLGSFREEIAPGAGFTEFSGKDGVPQWRAQGSLTWTKSDYELSMTTNFVDGYDRVVSNDKIGSWTTIDVQGVWKPYKLDGASVIVGTNNVFNDPPPEDPNFEGWPFFNRALASPRGRFVYLRAQYEF